MRATITYGTNNEFGFDYLRDNLAFRLEDRTQRKLSFAIIDEVDSILIDEAAHPAHHLGSRRREHRTLHQDQHADSPGSSSRRKRTAGRLRGGREDQAGHAHRGRASEVEELMAEIGLLRDGESLYDATNIR